MSGSKPGAGRGGRPRPAARGPIRPTAGASSLYERYKDALRRGHVAALRNRNDAAIEAYQEAAAIAPDRALPHASIGGILVKLNRPADAVASYDRALALAPHDETALRGLAETLTRVGRRPAAADALDRLASTLEAGGRTADATDAARRALELAETPERRARVEELVERLRSVSSGDEAADRALSQALKVLEVPEPPIAEAPAEEPLTEEIAPEAMRVEGADDLPTEALVAAVIPDVADDEPTTEPDDGIGPGAAAEAFVAPAAGAEAAVEPEATTAFEPEPGRGEAGSPADEAPPPTAEASEAAAELPEAPAEVSEPAGLGIALGAAAEGHLFAGELEEAHTGLLSAARAHRRAGRLVAAIDACYLAIGLAPADPDLHLLLAELYLDRGWRSQAADKLVLISRLADLDGDPATHARLCAIVTERLADEPRVADLCA
jgi:tetratricopeptide (TPR) repeat protein